MKNSPLALLALGLVACAPSIDPAMKQRTDAQLAELSGKNAQVGAPSSYELLPWEPGQWVVMKTTTDGNPSVYRLQILEADDGGFWLEMDQQGYEGRSQMRMKLKEQARTPEAMVDALQRIETKTEEGTQVVFDEDSAMADMQRRAAGGHLSRWVAPTNFEELKPETVTVPAGTFEGAVPARQESKVLWMNQKQTVWIHPEVPINGVVKMVDDNGKNESVLLDWGLEGAQSDF